jgi:hypothetical protein
MPILNLTTGLGTSNAIYVNTSYIIANQPPQMTTPSVFLFFAACGMILLLASRAIQEPTFKDLAGIMAAPLLLVSAIQAFAVDVITGMAFAGETDVPYLGAIIQTHTIYHYDLIGVVLGIFFLMSLGNLFLLWLDHNKVTQQEQKNADVSMRNRGMRNPNQPEGQDAEE